MEKLTLKAYAKINLHLDAVSKESNGYHKVITVMQTVSLYDDVTLSLRGDGLISIKCDIPTLPCDSRNLAFKAASLFFERTGIDSGVDIEIIKRIPMAAGLAGGSSDAAAVLSGLNSLCGNPLGLSELCELGAGLGADVPFCIVGGTKYADRYGDKLHSFFKMLDCAIVVSCAGEGVSTPFAYAELDSEYGDFAEGVYKPHSLDALSSAIERGDIRGIGESIFNIFESVVCPKRPMVNKIKGILKENGAFGAMMRGSGPSVFGIFPSEKSARVAMKALGEEGIISFLCAPVEIE